MSQRQRIDCPHERRPGMAVCLHCLHEARVEARERRQRAIMRFSVWTLGFVVVGIVGAAGANAVTRHPETPVRVSNTKRGAFRPVVERTDSVSTVAAAPVMQQGAPARTPPAGDSTSGITPAPTPAPAVVAAVAETASAPVLATPAPAAPVAAAPVVPSVKPVLPQGRTDLADSLFAERRADTVVVHFDTSPARTRRADKFESVVRQTLRSVYGAIADSILAAVPVGRLAAPNELLTTLPSKGIHLTGPHGSRIALWPETRPGRDGLLAVAYRTTVEQ